MRGPTRALLDPVALALLTAAVFDWLTGNPVHGVFLGVVSVALILDRSLSRSRGRSADLHRGGRAAGADDTEPSDPATCSSACSASPSRPQTMGAAVAGQLAATDGLQVAPPNQIATEASTGQSWPRFAVLALAGVSFALFVAAFPRFSWVTTGAIGALSAFAIYRAWERPPRSAGEAGRTYPRAGFIAWAIAFGAGALWELAALFQQPSLKVGSYDHPTISVIMDSVLAVYWGRALTLLAWPALGWLIFRELED